MKLVLALALVLIAWGLFVLLKRLLRRGKPAPDYAGEKAGRTRPIAGPSTGWPRQDRLALASLIVGTLLGILALLKP